MTFNLKTLTGLFTIGLIIGFFTCLSFTGCEGSASQPTVTIIPAKVLKIEVDTKDAAYQKKITSLRQINNELQKELKQTKTLLNVAKQTSKQQEQKVKKLIEPVGYSATELLRKVNAIPESLQSPCDSLADEVGSYLLMINEKDSLYEASIIEQDSIISVKDSLIQTSDTARQELKQFFALAVTQQQMLEKENKKLHRKLRRKKFGNTLKAIGLIAITGTITNYVNHH